ncbi:sensor histidine kinase [Archangium sp.]|uniref:sensor histidine kinase n=1 Tax=Archangium sp. TaxID=1872627 RepID=UPI00389A7BCA
MRAWFLEGLDRLLSERQRQLPPEELGRYRVLTGAILLNLALAVQMMITGLASPDRAFHMVAGPLALSGYVGLLALVRRSASPRVPALLLCSLLSAGCIAASFSMGSLAATHAANMLLPALSAYLLGARMGLVFTGLVSLNAVLLQPLQQVGFDLSQPLFPDERARVASIVAGFSFLGGWALNWLHVAAREQSHAVLDRTLSMLRKREGQLTSLIESTDDLVMALDVEGRLMTANQAVHQLFLQRQGREPRPGEPILDAFPELRESLWERLSEALGGQRVRSEQRFALGGRVLTMETTINPVLGEDGGVVELTFFGRDITQRKEAETRLSEMHRNLLDVSRMAGMAEIATGVLHNVGNTLNSVNVSANLVTERMNALRVPGLTKTVELLREHETDLGSFFTRDPRGRQLPAYLQALTQQLARDRESVLSEMRALSQSLEHIKLVVSMQQQHARFAGVLERVVVHELIDDALRLHAVSLEKPGIQLRREYSDVRPVVVDRHKLLQILVNLVSNAQHALLESGREDKQLTLRVEQSGTRLCIVVRDNGVGVAPEHLSRLFTQGFTTKRDGHGFGLHISAIAAGELGGSLRCTSAGPGEGATFTLELPAAVEAAAA